MNAIKSKWRLSAALSAAVVGSALLSVSANVEAAKFPHHAFLWLDDSTPGTSGYEPPASYSYCRAGNASCEIEAFKTNPYNERPRLGYYEFEIGVGEFPARNQVVFATPYNSNAYCTVGSHESLIHDRHVNCSKATMLNVRVFGNEPEERDGIDTQWNGVGSGIAAFGYLDDSAHGIINAHSGVSFNSFNSLVVTKREGPGIYLVRIPQMGTAEQNDGNSDGVAHVQAAAELNMHRQKRVCVIDSSNVSTEVAGALDIKVRCFGRQEPKFDEGFRGSQNLTAMDSPFVFSYEMPGQSLQRTVITSRLSTNSAYKPIHSHGNAEVVNELDEQGKAIAGKYNVFFPGYSPSGATNVQVTALGTDARFCNVTGWSSWPFNIGTFVSVACYRLTGDAPVAVNSKFSLGLYGAQSERYKIGSQVVFSPDLPTSWMSGVDLLDLGGRTV